MLAQASVLDYERPGGALFGLGQGREIVRIAFA